MTPEMKIALTTYAQLTSNELAMLLSVAEIYELRENILPDFQ